MQVSNPASPSKSTWGAYPHIQDSSSGRNTGRRKKERSNDI